MSLLDTLLPCTPPEPTGARIVRLLGQPKPEPDSVKRERRLNFLRRYYIKNKSKWKNYRRKERARK